MENEEVEETMFSTPGLKKKKLSLRGRKKYNLSELKNSSDETSTFSSNISNMQKKKMLDEMLDWFAPAITKLANHLFCFLDY